MDENSESVSQRISRLNSILSKTIIENKTDNGSTLISREELLDALMLLYDECNNEFLMKDPHIAEFVNKYRRTVLQLRELCVNINDFEIKKIISKGRFAEVAVVKEKKTEDVYVLKKIRKSDILNVQEGIYFENERNLYITASINNEAKKWIPKLFYSFQNMKFIYYLLEYCPGGNLCTMLNYYKKNVPEPMLKFYMAEMIEAIHSIHIIGFIHRDIKPENILIDGSGHLKIIDFGSSAKLLKNGLVNNKIILNIPHYTAPEVFKFHDISTVKGYGIQCDWWSLGIVLYEMITGSVPFTSDEIPKLYLSNNYSRKLQYPKQINTSQELKNIICGLLQPVEKRLTYEKLIRSDYFNCVSWECLRKRDPPFVPSLNSAEDTSYFCTFDIQRPTPKIEDFKLQRRFTGRNLPFLGFTYLWNEFVNLNMNAANEALFVPRIVTGDRRKTEYFDREVQDSNFPEVQRHSTGMIRNNEDASECSNESYQSAASDMFNCLTENQRKFLQEKELLMSQFKEKEQSFIREKEILQHTNEKLEHELDMLKQKNDHAIDSMQKMKCDYEDQINKLKKSDKLKKEAMAKLNMEVQQLNKELDGKTQKLKDTEDKLLNLSNQRGMLNKTRTNLRVKQDKYEQENLTLNNQLTEANRKISKLNAELEKKGKMKLDLEVKMTTTDKHGVERSFKSRENIENIAVNEMKEQIKQKQTEINKLSSEMCKRKELEKNCQKLEELLRLREHDYSELKLDYDVLLLSNSKIKQQCEQIEKKMTELEKKSDFLEEQKRKQSGISIEAVADNEIKMLKEELEKMENNLNIKEKNIVKLKEELQKAENDLHSLQQEKMFIRNEKENEIKNKNEEVKLLKNEIFVIKEKHQTEIEQQVKNLKKELNDKERLLTDFKEQISKMNEDLFSNLVTIEELKTVVCEKSSKITICENEISCLKKELHEKSQQVTNIRTSLNTTDKEKKKLETKIESLLAEVKQSNDIKLKEIESNKINSTELLEHFERSIREVLKENLSNKENVKTTDLESLVNTIQKKLSILNERSNVIENIQKFNVEPLPTAILEAQIQRLETQLEKVRETAVLQKEAAAQAKKELAASEKKLSDLKIDLRIAQRETKTAEEEVKKLQKTKYAYYKELKEEKQNLETNIQEKERNLKQCEEELLNLKHSSELKDNEIQEKNSIIKLLSSEIESLKIENEEYRMEKSQVECESNKKKLIIEELKFKINKLKEEKKREEINFNDLKEKENEWRTKYVNLEKTVLSVKETCVMLDKQVEYFENYSKNLEEKIEKLEEEKLNMQKELTATNEDNKIIRKQINEEKSLKIFAENRIRLMENDLSKKEGENKSLKESITTKMEQIKNMEEKINQLEEYISTANDSMQKNSQYIELMKKEIGTLKQDRSELLTNIHRLKEKNNSLQNELKEATDDLNDLQEANGELQSILTQVETYHEIQHLKDNATLQQHSKLIEFLQNKFQDATKHKRTLADKLFGSRGKENLNPKELENLLYLERNKAKGLAEQLYQARIELMMLKGENISKCSSPKLISDYESCLSHSTSTKNNFTSISSNFCEIDNTIYPRLKHNIPHKFDTKICTKTGCKCAVCNQLISFGQKMSNCKECHIWCHISCTVKIGPTCGLSQAMFEQFSSLKHTTQSSSSIGSSIKSEVEGSIKVLRDEIWEKMNVKIQDKQLLLFDKSNSAEPKEQISFNAINTINDNDDKIILSSMNISEVEKCCILKILYQINNKQEKSLYMLAASEEEKINWMNILKRNVSSSQKQITFKLDRDESFRGNVIGEFKKSNDILVNQIIQLSPELCILAANEGLFSLKLNQNSEINNAYTPVKISGVCKVTKIKVLTKLRIALLICEDNNSLKKCDLRMLVSNAEAAECSSPCITISEASNLILSLKNCRLLEASSCNTLLAVATASYLLLIEWKDDGFDIIKYKRKIPDVKCIIFTRQSLLFNTENEFYCINLTTFQENKLNLFKCGNDITSKLCKPEAITKISANLYLICDKLFGIFVDAEGKRIKSADTMKWPLELRKIVYNKPFLCITHDNCVSLIYLPSSSEDSEEKLKFSIIDFNNPSILGIVKDPVRGIFLKEECQDSYKLFFLDPIVFMKKNPKQSWSSISTHSGGETTEEECIQKSLNISDETEISLCSSILEDNTE